MVVVLCGVKKDYFLIEGAHSCSTPVPPSRINPSHRKIKKKKGGGGVGQEVVASRFTTASEQEG
jgi:hypothetical protein